MSKQLLTICSILFILMLSATASATDYYVDATDGNDDSNGLSANFAWQTIAKVNASNFSAGDTIKFQCGDVWREQLEPNSSGTDLDGNEITFTNYGTGDNPLIRQTDEFNDWTEVNDTYNIYRGSIGSNKRYFGMLDSDANNRVPNYVTAPSPGAGGYSVWPDGYFHGYGSAYNGTDGYFFYKSNSGNPGAREVGMRKHGIYINGKSYIVIDGIDFYGPTGTTGNGETDTAASTITIYPYNSSYITIKNCNFTCCRNYAIRAKGSSTHHITVEDCVIDRCWGGISFGGTRTENEWNVNNIRRCTVTNTGLTPEDSGNRGNIVCTNADSVTIESCYTEGADFNDGKTTDYSMTFADGASYIKLQKNYIKNARQGGILYDGDTNDRPGNIEICYNIIENWGTHEGEAGDATYDGIRIGDGNEAEWSYCGATKICNNLLIDGNSTGANFDGTGEPYAGLFIGNYDFNNIVVKNNIFYNCGDYFDIRCNADAINEGRFFQNNCFYRTNPDSNSIWWQIVGTPDIYDYNHVIGASSGYWQYDEIYASYNIAENPLFVDAENGDYSLQFDSNCIDAGNDVSLTEDYEGNPVPSGNVPDIGAYEFGSASNPLPVDKTTSVSVTADLSWTKGTSAADTNGSEIYLGTEEQTVADANHSSSEYKGAIDGNTYDPGTMSGSTTYYWAIDTVNDSDTWAGSVWSFTTENIPPGQASNPSPANSATDVNTAANLSWTAGSSATSYNVYFGTTSPGTEMGNQAGTTFATSTMSNNTTYYWRIDSVNSNGTTTGTAWSFTTALDPNLVSWWKFDEGSGSTAYDFSSGGQNDGTLIHMNETDWIAGHDGNGLDFVGDGQYVTCGNDSSLDITDEVTICAWIDWDGYVVNNQTITFKGDELGLFLTNNSNARIGYYASFGGGASTHVCIPNTSVATGSWVHLAVTYANDANHQLTAYNNGAEDGYTTSYSGDLGTNTNNLLIGNDTTLLKGYEGTLDDVRIYNRKLSASEINDIYIDN